jgi:hypothetical protein
VSSPEVESAEQALAALRAARRSRRIRDLDPFDALYKAYLGGSLSLLAAYTAIHTLGEQPVVGDQLVDVLDWAPRIAGLIVAVAWAVGARSGGRGGPVALERADVSHVLLGPVDRRYALRTPALRAIRFAAFVGLSSGALVGIATAQRINGLPIVWILAPALVGAFGFGGAAALGVVISGLRTRRWIANVIALVIMAPSIVDVVQGTDVSPFTWLARLGIAAKEFDAVALVALLVPIVVLVVALRVVGGISIEAAERRASLVTQLRFAATVRDVRAVMQLRRQLSNETPRGRPWIAIKSGRSPLVFVRDLRSILRWPLMRILRLLAFGAIAGVVATAVWRGNITVIAVLGLLGYLIGLEAVEPLAEEADRPDLVRSYPRPSGWLLLGHLPAAFAVALIALAPALIVVAVDRPDGLTVPVMLLSIACASLGALIGGAMSALANVNFGTSSSPDVNAMGADALSIILLVKIVAPPAMATLSWVPLVVARSAWINDRPVLGATAATVGAIAMLFVIFCGWLRFRDQISSYTAETKEITKSTFDPKAIVEHYEKAEKGSVKS